jgi:hypothetical protein
MSGLLYATFHVMARLFNTVECSSNVQDIAFFQGRAAICQEGFPGA